MNKNKQENILHFAEDCKYDELVPLNQLIFSPENEEMYGDIRSTKKIYIQDLAENIKTHGIVEALSVDRKTNQIERGHHRYIALELSGHTKAPVIYVNSPKDRYEKKLKMMSSNMRSPQNPAEKYELIRGLIEEYYKKFGEVPSPKLEREFCSSVQTTPLYYKMSKELKKERPDLFDKVKDGKMALRAAVNMAKADKTKIKDNTIHPQFKNFIQKDWVKDVAGSVQLYMHDITNKGSKIGNNIIQPLKGIQQNIIGGVIHEVFSRHLAEILTQKTDSQFNHLSDQSAFDMEINGFSWNVDVKGTFDRKYWSAGKKIRGYVVFLKYSEDYSRWFIAYGATKDKDWTRGTGGGYHYKFDTLFQNKDDFNILMGDITKEKGKLVLHTDAII